MLNTVASSNKLDKKEKKSRNKSKKSPRLSRPERKALERAEKKRKEQNTKRRKHNFSARQSQLAADAKGPNEGRYDLHSTALPRLCPDESTADDVMRAIKRAQNLHDAHDLRNIERFLLEQTPPNFAYGYKGSLLARLAVASLHMQNHEIARKALDVRHADYRANMMPMESAAIIRGLLRVHNVTDALEVLEDELSLPLPGTMELGSPLVEQQIQDRLKYRARSLASLASREFFEAEPLQAVRACQKLAELGPIVREVGLTAEDVKVPWDRILRGASQCEAARRKGQLSERAAADVDDNKEEMPCNVVYAVLSAMTTFPADNSDRVYELLSNALVRRTVFVTGAVDMQGCPPADRGEACFIGRSNVGKSSLINMITNRKSLAYTSKRPGKTQQFNFFAVNDKVGREREIKYGDVVEGEKDEDSFYIVDLPGFGYAKVPEAQRQEWLAFMHEYICNRKTLRCVFHLIDSRHGPTDEDAAIMQQLANDLPNGKDKVSYVVVLTKADKNVKGVASSASGGNSQKAGKVPRAVMQQLRDVMNDSGLSKVPVIQSSSETKLGRDDLWRYLKHAAEA